MRLDRSFRLLSVGNHIPCRLSEGGEGKRFNLCFHPDRFLFSLSFQNVAVGVLNKVKDFGKEAKDTIEDEVNKDVDKVAEMTHMKPW